MLLSIIDDVDSADNNYFIGIGKSEAWNVTDAAPAPKNSLRDDIIRTERVAESASNRVKTVQDEIDTRLRQVSDISRESEKDVRNTMREVEDRIDDKMEKLDESLRDTIQKALDNPLGEG